jgi:hypothetical protein
VVQVIEEAFQAVMAREPERLKKLQAQPEADPQFQARQAKLRAEAEHHKRLEDQRWALTQRYLPQACKQGMMDQAMDSRRVGRERIRHPSGRALLCITPMWPS